MNLKPALPTTVYDFFKKYLWTQFDKRVSGIFSRLKWLCFSLLFWKFCMVVHSDNFMLKPFSITPALNQQGLNGKMFTEGVVECMDDIINFKDPSTSRGNAFRQVGKTFTESKVLIVEGNQEPNLNPYLFNSLLKSVKKALSDFMFQGKYISGSIVNDISDSTQWLVSIQITNKPIKKIAIKKTEQASTILKTAASIILQETNPIALLDYYIKINNLKEASSLLNILRQDEPFNIDKNRKFRLDVSTITLELAQSHALLMNLDSTNRNAAVDKRKTATDLSDKLLVDYSQDVASYVQKLSSLSYACHLYSHFDSTIFKDNQQLKIEKLEMDNYKKQFKNTLTQFLKEEKYKTLHSDYYNLRQAKGFIYTTIGYLFTAFDMANADEIESFYTKALEFSPNDAYVLNACAYFYAMNLKNKTLSYQCIGKALEMNKTDGNLMDTYAEIAWSFKDTATFYYYFEQALKHPKPIDGIVIEQYEKDKRWKALWTKQKFQFLMHKYGSKIFVMSHETLNKFVNFSSSQISQIVKKEESEYTPQSEASKILTPSNSN